MQTVSRLKPGDNQVETSLLSALCLHFCLCLYSSADSHARAWSLWDSSQPTWLQCNGAEEQSWRGCKEQCGSCQLGNHTCLGDQVQQVLTLGGSHSILIYLTSKHQLREWHLLLSNQREHCSKHHKKSKPCSLWKSLHLQYTVTQLVWKRWQVTLMEKREAWPKNP